MNERWQTTDPGSRDLRDRLFPANADHVCDFPMTISPWKQTTMTTIPIKSEENGNV
jgi:hypothetical protein